MEKEPKFYQEEPNERGVDPERNPVVYSFEDNLGSLEVIYEKDSENYNNIVRIKGSTGEWIEINSLLPKVYSIDFRKRYDSFFEAVTDARTHFDPDRKEITLTQREAETEGWKYLIAILHEVGHVVIARDQSEKFIKLDALYKRQKNLDIEQQKQMLALSSENERSAWAFAIRQLRNITKELGMPIKEIFSDSKELMDYINKKLMTYKSGAMTYDKFLNYGGLASEIEKLYVHDRKKGKK